jgi:hypothetical protein
VTADPEAARSSPEDEGEHDKAGDERCHHPQQEPLVRFHRFPKECGPRSTVLFLEGGLVTAMAVMILFWCASDLVSGANRMTVRTAVV